MAAYSNGRLKLTAVSPEISLSKRLLCLFPFQKVLLEGGKVRDGRARERQATQTQSQHTNYGQQLHCRLQLNFTVTVICGMHVACKPVASNIR